MTSEDKQQEQWDNVVSGKSSPNHNDPLEQKAHRTRQIILWELSNKATEMSSEEAQRIYIHASKANKKRKILHILKYLLLLVTLLSVAYLLRYNFKSEVSLAPASGINTSSTSVETDSDSSATSFSHVPTSLKPVVVADPDTYPQTVNVDMLKIFVGYPLMVTIPKGSFQMGCNEGWDDQLGGCRANEKPPHTVTIKSFSLSKYETTVGQFKQFVNETNYLTTAEEENKGCTIKSKMGTWVVSKEHNWKHPGFEHDSEDQHPVVCISWEDAHAYITWLSKKKGIQYRLPTEEEWEYAARGGKATAYYWGELADRNFANYQGAEGADHWQYTSTVGALRGNLYELHDMAGNAWEWVESCWRDTYANQCRNQNIRTRRGGAWDSFPLNIRHSYRSKGNKKGRSYLYGFRVAHD